VPSNYLIRSLSGGRSPLRMLSPYLLGQRGMNNNLFLPRDRDLPVEGLALKAQVFDFGFNPGTNVIAPYQESDVSLVLQRNFIPWAIVATAVVVPATTTALTQTIKSPAYLFNILHQHDDKIFQMFNKGIADLEGAGSAQNPYLLKEPSLVLNGDSLQVDIQNTGNYFLQAQIVLWGGEFA
jgi:hypothetical protein